MTAELILLGNCHFLCGELKGEHRTALSQLDDRCTTWYVPMIESSIE